MWNPCNGTTGNNPVAYLIKYGLGSQDSWTECVTGSHRDLKSMQVPGGQVAFQMKQAFGNNNCAGYVLSQPYDPCNSYSGGFTLTMTRKAANLVLTGSASKIERGQSLSVTWAATPDSLGSWKTPVTVKQIWFEPDSILLGGVPADSTKQCVVSGSGCTITPNGSGTLHVRAFVNGKLIHQSTHVDVTPCLNGNALLDAPGVRQLLDTLWKLSNANDPVTANRREQAGTVYDSAGIKVSRLVPGQPNHPCKSYSIPYEVSWGTVRVMVHTHPFAVWDTLPNVTDCVKPGGLGFNGPGYGGPSPEDWRLLYELSQQGSTVTHGMVMNQNFIYVFEPHPGSWVTTNAGLPTQRTEWQPSAGWQQKVTRYSRKNSCPLP